MEQLRDNCMDTYWQSDGQLPHLVNIQFQRKTTINQIYIYTDYKLDESYTPSKISIRSGTHFNDLQEIEIVELNEPAGLSMLQSIWGRYTHSSDFIGWVVIPIEDIREQPIRTFMIQIAVISNHQNGRDTHMRQIKIHSPIEGRNYLLEEYGPFSTLEFQQYRTLR